MSEKLQWFKWHPADFDVDENVKLMNLEEVGLYALCLNHAWVNRSLPADTEEIRRAMKLSAVQFKRCWPRVARCFTISPENPERLINSRQEEERSKAVSKSEKASKSVRTRYERSEDVALRASASVSSSGSVSESQTTNPEKAAPRAKGFAPFVSQAQADSFEQFWAVYWRKAARQAAAKEFSRKVLTHKQFEAVIRAVERQTPTMLARDPETRPHASTWLNQERFNDEPEPPPISLQHDEAERIARL